uniref:Succinate dehydrogenase assembly factor 3 n=1 Tax=Panagrellus redivivus TaxID=6233 RepID=A0A7E4UWY6_PANRE
MSTPPNVGRFPLVLYKRILRLHYGLPTPEMRLMGDTYVKDEFRRHKDAPSPQALEFLKQWTDYCMLLSKQLSNKGIAKGKIGKELDPATIESLDEQRLYQLYELKVESDNWKSGPGVEKSDS